MTMPPTTGYSFGDIVLVPFPFSDQSGTKRRPAVVVSSQRYHTERPDLVIMAVTSRVRPSGGFAKAPGIAPKQKQKVSTNLFISWLLACGRLCRFDIRIGLLLRTVISFREICGIGRIRAEGIFSGKELFDLAEEAAP